MNQNPQETPVSKSAKIPVYSIYLVRAEGPVNELDQPQTVTTWDDADEVLRKWGKTAPEDGGYDKCDFVVTWETRLMAFTSGRFDLVRGGKNDNGHTLRKQVVEYVKFCTGMYRPASYTEEEYQMYLKTFVSPEDQELMKKILRDCDLGIL